MFVKKIIYAVFIVSLLVVPILGKLNIKVCKDLGGVVPPDAEEVAPTLSNFFAGSLQPYITSKIKKEIGLRNFFIRTYNQIEYSLYNKTKSTIVLADGSFIFYDYLKSYYGNDYDGINKINKYTDEFLYVQNKLKEKNKAILLVLAPNKAYFREEFIQKQHRQTKNDSTNYDVLIKVLKEKQINVIDFQDYFFKIKDTLSYPVFPKYGIHWSGYASTIAADSLFPYVYSLVNFEYTPYIKTKGYETNSEYRFTDNDLEELANLLFRAGNETICYPEITFKHNEKKPNALLIGDSFTQSFYGFYPFLDSLFSSDSRYWYYSSHIGWPTTLAGGDVNKLNFHSQIKNRDVFVIVETIANIDSYFTDNFVNDLYNFLKFDEIKKDFALAPVEYNIKQDSAYYSSIKEKAKANNMSVKEQLMLDILWMFKQTPEYKCVLEKTINQIKNNAEQYKSIKEKAKANNFKEESQLEFDAQWMIEHEFEINE